MPRQARPGRRWDAYAGKQCLHWIKHSVVREMFFLCSSFEAVVNPKLYLPGCAGYPAWAVYRAHGIWGCTRTGSTVCCIGPGWAHSPRSSFAAGLEQPWLPPGCGSLQGCCEMLFEENKKPFLEAVLLIAFSTHVSFFLFSVRTSGSGKGQQWKLLLSTFLSSMAGF